VTWPKGIPAGLKTPLRDGGEKSHIDGYGEDVMFINANNKARPEIRDRDGRTPLAEEDGRPYAGCYVHAILQLWAQDNKWGKRINASLLGIQFAGDGDAFSGGAKADDDDFEDLDFLD